MSESEPARICGFPDPRELVTRNDVEEPTGHDVEQVDAEPAIIEVRRHVAGTMMACIVPELSPARISRRCFDGGLCSSVMVVGRFAIHATGRL
jgi:hypothetical protein